MVSLNALWLLPAGGHIATSSCGRIGNNSHSSRLGVGEYHDDVISRQTSRQTVLQRTEGGAARTAPTRKLVAATVRRVVREDRRILKALAAFDRGERPAA